MGPDPDVVNAIQRLRERFRDDIPIERAILFGSRARGDDRSDSDADVLLVSPAFEGKSAMERGVDLHLAWDVDVPVDLLCYTPDEFEELKDRPSLVRVAVEEGVEVGG